MIPIPELPKTPQTPTEKLIFDTMVAEGYDPADIEFRHKNLNGPRYLRYHYWKPVQIKNQQVAALLQTETMWDDDCGTLYFYEFNQ